MVMQNKVSSESTEIDNGEILPFQLVLLEGVKKKEKPIKKLTKRTQHISQILYDVVELVDLKIKINTYDDEPVYIDWGSVKENGVDYSAFNFSLSKRDVIHPLYLSRVQNNEYPWRCGMYHFEVSYKGEKYYGGFKVQPKNVDKIKLNKIHDLIHKHLEGLAIDFVNYKETFSSIDNFERSGYWQFIQWYKRNEQKVHQTLTMIENNSQNELQRHYVIEHVPKHIDSRGIRWENTAKGQTFKGTRFMNRKLIQDLDSNQNRLVKHRVLQLVIKMDQSTRFINKINSEVESYFKQLSDDVNNLETQNREIQMNNRITEKEKGRIKSTLITKKIELNEAEQRATWIRSILSKLKPKRKLLSDQMLSPFWSRVSDKHPNRFTIGKYAGYQLFHQIWMYSDQLLLENHMKKIKFPVYKPTYELYEYYVYLSIINLFQEIDFHTEQDTITEQLMTTFFENGLKDGTKVNLQKDNLQVDIVYDEMVEHSDNAAIEKGTHFYSGGVHRKPDIRIDLYKNSRKYSSSFIIEVKYSPFINIYNDQGKTKAMEQMTDYWNIMHVNQVEGQNEYNHRAINSVVCVYPGKENQPIVNRSGFGVFLQFYPSEESGDLYDIVGKSELKNLISHWLDTYQT